MAHTAANSLTTNPIILEIFNADVTISATPITVKAITFHSAAAADVFALQDGLLITSHVVVGLAQTVNGGSMILDFGENGFTFDKLYFDTSEVNSGLGANDRVCIYLK